MFYRSIFVAAIFLLFANSLLAQFSIKGKVNLSEDWQAKIYMASINKLSDYYRTSPDMIVTTATIDSSGYFELKGNNIPNEKRFYRLYMMKGQNSDYDACLYVGGDDHNFAHILLKNGEELEINSDPNSVSPFGDYTVKGSKENELMRSLADIVFPSFYFYRIKFPTELKFSEQNLHADLKSFVDTCSSTAVALAAINNTDFDAYFEGDECFYWDFGDQLKADMPNWIYTKNYLRKLKYYSNEEAKVPIWAFIVMGILGILLAYFLYQYFQQKQRIITLQTQIQKPIPIETKAAVSVAEILTQKEQEIFTLIKEGKSNKEIASALFVELSTVKSHINNIYSKLGVSNRREAKSF